jgi:hypothetical protein
VRAEDIEVWREEALELLLHDERGDATAMPARPRRGGN